MPSVFEPLEDEDIKGGPKSATPGGQIKIIMRSVKLAAKADIICEVSGHEICFYQRQALH